MDKAAALTLIAICVTVIPLSFGLALWLVMRLRRRADRPLAEAPDGAIAVPVRGLARGGFLMGRSHNSLNPRLAIARDGLHFRVIRADHWPFAEIAKVDVPWAPFATRVSFTTQGGRWLFVDVSDAAKARDLLRALPPGLPLTPRAIALREGDAPGSK